MAAALPFALLSQTVPIVLLTTSFVEGQLYQFVSQLEDDIRASPAEYDDALEVFETLIWKQPMALLQYLATTGQQLLHPHLIFDISHGLVALFDLCRSLRQAKANREREVALLAANLPALRPPYIDPYSAGQKACPNDCPLSAAGRLLACASATWPAT
jgi:hypothetical protein